MKALAQHQLIHPHGSKVLNEAYSFFRRLENMIQIVNDQQTHCLPHDPSEITALARRMSLNGEFSEKSRLLSEWRHHSRLVHRLFNGLFEADYERVELEEAISANLATCTTHEEKADSLPWFKHQEVKRLALLDLNNKIAIPDLLRRLSLVAEVVVHTAWLLACESLTERFGEPSLENGSRASFAILGLGRLGTSEIDYGSDLDLCFLYSGDGKTSGPEVINNPEFFTRLSQRIISLISVNSRYGRAYQIDSELRPSGRQGSLVTTLDTFCEYHLTKAKLWERQSLLKARVITGDETFCKEIKSTLVNLTYKTPLPDESQMLSEIFKLRQRFEIEKAKEKEGVYNLKIGCGGTADIEMIIQYSQLKNVKKQSELWVQNSFDLLEALLNINILNVEYYDILYSSLQFYRLLTARQRLFTNSATDLLDFNAPHIAALTQSLGYASPEVLKAELEKIRQSIRDLYNVYFVNPPTLSLSPRGEG
jgi:glutamate-ammonia-ligase adenylyltransferase